MIMTNEEVKELTMMKKTSKKTADKFVMDELLHMGFSYNNIGTHYLHESIVASIGMRLEDFNNVSMFCQKVGNKVYKKYNVNIFRYSSNIERAIERAFDFGNTDYLLDMFKSSYNECRAKVTKNTFIMTVRKKILDEMKRQNAYNVTQLRIIIQGELENINDESVLDGIRKIVDSLSGGDLIFGT